MGVCGHTHRRAHRGVRAGIHHEVEQGLGDAVLITQHHHRGAAHHRHVKKPQADQPLSQGCEHVGHEDRSQGGRTAEVSAADGGQVIDDASEPVQLLADHLRDVGC